MPQPIIFVDSTEKLRKCIQEIEQATRLCADTEFVRTRTYYSNLGLIQVSDGKASYVIDIPALEQDDLDSIKACLYSPDIELVFYACSEDLEVLLRAFGSLPNNFYDLQIGLSLLGEDAGQGFSKAVSKHLGIELEKSQTLTDWMMRPLTEEQLRYAADDVEYLSLLADKLFDSLHAQGRKEWLAEESLHLRERCLLNTDIRQVYLKAKGLERLNDQQQRRLIALTEWREKRAQRKNIPRGFVLKDPVLQDLAKHAPTSVEEVARVAKLDPQRKSALLCELSDLLSDKSTSELHLPDMVPKRSAKDRDLNSMKTHLTNLADEAGIAVSLLARKKDIERYLYTKDSSSHPLYPQWLNGWRAPFYAQAEARRQ